jgi:hypothetical protein
MYPSSIDLSEERRWLSIFRSQLWLSPPLPTRASTCQLQGSPAFKISLSVHHHGPRMNSQTLQRQLHWNAPYLPAPKSLVASCLFTCFRHVCISRHSPFRRGIHRGTSRNRTICLFRRLREWYREVLTYHFRLRRSIRESRYHRQI